MQSRDMAEKIRLIIDGEEWKGLVNVGERNREKDMIEVPEFNKRRKISNGQEAVPEVPVIYKVSRDSQTYSKILAWYTQNQEKDVTVIKTDASGVEYARQLWPQTVCRSVSEPQYDGAAPVYAQLTMILLPWDIIDVDSEV